MTRPFAATLGLNPYSPQSNVIVPTSFTGGVETNILNISPGTPGYVAAMRIALFDFTSVINSVIKVYVDGEGTPSINCDTGTLLAANVGGNGCFSVKHLAFTYVAAHCGVFNFMFPIPFKSSIRITLTVSNTCTASPTTIYYTGVTIPYKLISSCQKYAGKQTYTATQQSDQTVKFLNLGAGNAGWIAFHCIAGDNSSDSTWMENAPVMFLDGASLGGTPQYNAGGMEEYFKTSGSYWNGGITQAQWSTTSVVSNATGIVTAGIDLLALFGGVKFSNGIVMCLQAGAKGIPAGDANVDLAWLVLYYVANP